MFLLGRSQWARFVNEWEFLLEMPSQHFNIDPDPLWLIAVTNNYNEPTTALVINQITLQFDY